MSAVPVSSASPSKKTLLLSYGPPQVDANPFTTLFEESISPQYAVEYFSWKTALVGRYDAFNVHWPETLLRRRTVRGRVASAVFGLALVARLRTQRIPTVRMLHNRRPHETGNALERYVLRALDRSTTMTITMNSQDTQATARSVQIPHGHYRDWYRPSTDAQPRPGLALTFGLLRPYKGIDDLIAAFSTIDPALGFALEVKGNAHDTAYLDSIRAASDGLSNVSIDARHIPDAELADAIRSATLVVLPYRNMSNSGAAILALSLDTPVLVPKNIITEELREEVGPGWVHTFEGTISSDDVSTALRAVAEDTARSSSPDLSQRDWSTTGRQYMDVFSGVIS